MRSDPLDIVVLLNSPEATQREYREGIPAEIADVSLHIINDVADIDGYLAGMDVLMTYGAFLRGRAPEVFRASSRLRWVQALGSGIDHLVPNAGERDDIAVTCIRGIQDGAVAEAVFAGMLALCRDLPRSFAQQRAQIWDRQPSRLLEGKTIGLLGVGLIASAVARRAKAFDMRVIGISSRHDRPEHVDEMRARGDLVAAVHDVDILVVLSPYNAANHHLVGRDVLAAMKPGSVLINVARGGVVDEAALIEALDSGGIAGAALDVFEEEPLPRGHRFWDMPNVIVTPHVAGMNVDYVKRALPTIVHNIRCFRAGEIARMRGLVRMPKADGQQTAA